MALTINIKGNKDTDEYKEVLVLKKSLQKNYLKANDDKFQNHRNKRLIENI